MKSGHILATTRVSLERTNLIVHQGITNILHQTVKLMRVLRFFKERSEILPGRHQAHILANRFQFPGNSRASDPALDLGEYGLTVPACLPSPPH